MTLLGVTGSSRGQPSIPRARRSAASARDPHGLRQLGSKNSNFHVVWAARCRRPHVKGHIQMHLLVAVWCCHSGSSSSETDLPRPSCSPKISTSLVGQQPGEPRRWLTNFHSCAGTSKVSGCGQPKKLPGYDERERERQPQCAA